MVYQKESPTVQIALGQLSDVLYSIVYSYTLIYLKKKKNVFPQRQYNTPDTIPTEFGINRFICTTYKLKIH